MKVLFAVSNDSITTQVVNKYQERYKEIITSKNVYYFNAIIKELQRDKGYDVIIIGEDLEPISNNNYEAIDKFLIDKLDSISDEASKATGEDIPIIFICSDRRTKSDQLLRKLFSMSIYNALVGNDRSLNMVCALINKPRNKKEAKKYYQIDTDQMDYESTKEEIVSETQIQNILSYYKKIGNNEKKCVQAFDRIAKQYDDTQLRIIVKFLPMDVKAILEMHSSRYQTLMNNGTVLGNGSYNKYDRTPNTKPKNLEFVQKDIEKSKMTKPVVIPEIMKTSNVSSVQSNPVQQNYNYSNDNNQGNSQYGNMQQRQNAQYNSYNQQMNYSPYRNPQQANNPYGNTQQPSNPYGNVQQPSNPYGNIQQPSNPYGNIQQPNNPYGNTQQSSNPYGNVQQPSNPYGNIQQPNNPYGSVQQPNNPYGSVQQPNNPYGNTQQPNNPYGNTQQPNNPYGNIQKPNKPAGSIQQSNNLYESTQQSNNPYEDTEKENRIETEKHEDESVDNNEFDTGVVDSNETEKENVESIAVEPVKRRRGRPRKIIDEDESISVLNNNDESSEKQVDKEQMELTEPLKRKRGRPKKIENDQTLSLTTQTENNKPLVVSNQQENGKKVFDNNYQSNDSALNNQDDEDLLLTKQSLDNGDSLINNQEENEDIFMNQQEDDEPINLFDLDIEQTSTPENINDTLQNNAFSNYNNNNMYTNNSVYGNNDLNNTMLTETKNSFNSKKENSFVSSNNVIVGNGKIVAFVGTTKNGTSFIINNLAFLLSKNNIRTAVLDLTKNKNAYYMFTNNDSRLMQIATNSMNNLENGVIQGIKVNACLDVFTSLPDEINSKKLNDAAIIQNISNNYDIILLDCDFETNEIYFANSNEMYLVQTMDAFTIQPLTKFLSDLKIKNLLDESKIRIIINKHIKLKRLDYKMIIGGMSKYNEPAMTLQRDLFNPSNIPSILIPFEEQNYAKYLESIAMCQITLNDYSQNFIQSLEQLKNMVYPLIAGNNSNYGGSQYGNYQKNAKRAFLGSKKNNSRFSSNVNDTLNKMRTNNY